MAPTMGAVGGASTPAKERRKKWDWRLGELPSLVPIWLQKRASTGTEWVVEQGDRARDPVIQGLASQHYLTPAPLEPITALHPVKM